MAEEFVSREGTDYGIREISFEAKVQQVLIQIRRREVVIVFDMTTQTCNLREAKQLSQTKAPSVSAPPAWIIPKDNGFLIKLYIQPGASRSEIYGLHGTGADTRLKIKINAPPPSRALQTKASSSCL